VNRKSLLLSIGFVLFWNSGFIGAEFGLKYSGPFSLMFWRYFALSFFLFAYLLLRKRLKAVRRSAIIVNMLVGVLAHGVWLACVLWALDYGVPAGIVALVVALQPLATGAFSGMVTGEPTPLHRWLGLLVGFAGVGISVLSGIDFDNPESVFAYLVPIGSVIAITAATLIQRKMEIKDAKARLPIDLSLFYQSVATALALALPAIFVENLQAEWSKEFIGIMLWLVFAVSLLAYTLMWILIKRIDATRVAGLFYLGPPVTMLMAWATLGDTPGSYEIIGLIVVFAGVVLTQWNFGKIRKSI
jgi:drug/metabolite transporter (DMT)-like permease